MQLNILKAKLIEKGYTTEKIVKTLKDNNVKMTKNTWYNKQKGVTSFTQPEIYALIKILDLNEFEIKQIFFTNRSE